MARRRDDVDRLQGEIEELFDELWRVPSFAGLRTGFRPQVDCFRTQDPPELTVVVELPGVDPADIQVAVRGRELLVEGVRRRPNAAGRAYARVEIEHGPFQRRISLAEDVDVDRARTTLERGMLTIVLPLAPRPPQLTRVVIEVRSHS
jgi:HSP20 family protein